MKNYIEKFKEEDYIENIFDIKELKNFNFKKYYDFYILERHFEELGTHGFKELKEIPIDIQLYFQKKICKRIKKLVNLRLCLLNKISQRETLPNFETNVSKKQNFILNPFCNVLNTQKSVNDEINKQLLFLY